LLRVEDEIVSNLQSDPMAAYDVDVRDEGFIIESFRAMCSSSSSSSSSVGVGVASLQPPPPPPPPPPPSQV